MCVGTLPCPFGSTPYSGQQETLGQRSIFACSMAERNYFKKNQYSQNALIQYGHTPNPNILHAQTIILKSILQTFDLFIHKKNPIKKAACIRKKMLTFASEFDRVCRTMRKAFVTVPFRKFRQNYTKGRYWCLCAFSCMYWLTPLHIVKHRILQFLFW